MNTADRKFAPSVSLGPCHPPLYSQPVRPGQQSGSSREQNRGPLRPQRWEPKMISPLPANTRDAGRAIGDFTDMTYQGIFSTSSLVVAKFNCDGLTDHKLQYLLCYMHNFHIRILNLQDTHLDKGRRACKHSQVNTGGKSAVVSSSAEPPFPQKRVSKHYELVGGMMILITLALGTRITSKYLDRPYWVRPHLWHGIQDN